MALQPGDRIGGYEILSTLGAGGMGVVYRARDVKLGRDVAIKTLPEAVAADPDRLARFEREARALAALNHPNVATIYGFERADATHFLTMEVVEGATLADRIERGPIPLEQALRLFIQIAEGLEAAHAKGIIHRDLKPANIKIGAGASSGEVRPGAVKILDFGLAKALTPEGERMAAGASHSPTLTRQATMRGEILGTAAYMSPEQAQGQPADERADIWAFGACLLESLTGRRAFGGDNASLVLASVLKDEPDWGALPASTPPAVRRLLRRCLEKKRDRRLHDIADARLDLEEALAAPFAESAPVAAPRRRPFLLWTGLGAGLILGVAGTSLIARWTRPAPASPPVARFFIDSATVGTDPKQREAFPSSIAIAHDCSLVAYTTGVTGTVLRARRLDQLEDAVMTGTETGAFSPFFSPDDRWIGYFNFTERALRKVPVLGGPSVTISNVPQLPVGATWGAGDTIVLGQVTGPLLSVRASGGELDTLTPLAQREVAHRTPEFLPGGETVLFSAFESVGAQTGSIHALTLSTGTRKLILEDATQPRYAAPDHLIYANGTDLFAVAFDPARLEVTGDPVRVADEVSGNPYGTVFYAVSATGTLVYVTGGATAGQFVPVWVDRAGREEPIGAPPKVYVSLRLSPDGGRIAMDALEAEDDLWIWDLGRESLSQVTFSSKLNRAGGLWSTDGRAVFFGQQSNDGWEIVRSLADGTGETTVLSIRPEAWLPTSVSSDGAGLVASTGSSIFTEDIAWVDTTGKAEPRMLLDPEFQVQNGELSPDGRWLAYESLESGAAEVFVRPFPEIDSARWPVSTFGGTRPAWSRDGREIFYLDPRDFLTAVRVEPRGDALIVGRPEVLIEKAYVNPVPGRSWDVSADGRRFLMLAPAAATIDARAGRIVMVQNWLDELRRAEASRR
jgi:serine/threonine-protein kinase